MNKLILFPLLFLFLLSVFTNIFATTATTNSTMEVPHAGQRWFDLGSPSSILIILTVALAVGMISGFTFLGSGFSDFSQTLMFDFAIFIGIWACLTIIASEYLFDNIVLTTLYLILTFIYVIGVGMSASQGSSG
jgi:hypothetical protein